jgi:multidrug resistance efflux pump
LPIRDNQFVRTGDLLFEIDPSTYQANLDQVSAQLDQTGSNIKALGKQVEASQAAVEGTRAKVRQARSTIGQLVSTIDRNKAEYERQIIMLPEKATSQRALGRAKTSYDISLEEKIPAEAVLSQSQSALAESEAALAEVQAQLGALGESNPQIRASLAAVRQAQLNLDFTKIRAPADGYVTNLNLSLGSHAVANQPVLALVDVNSYWIYGFFKENDITGIHAGDRAVVTLMSYPGSPIGGSVDSIGWGIAQHDGRTGSNLLPSISPTFEWIRLAQRLPVRIHLTNVPREVALRVGTTCSVMVMTGTTGRGDDRPVPLTPRNSSKGVK